MKEYKVLYKDFHGDDWSDAVILDASDEEDAIEKFMQEFLEDGCSGLDQEEKIEIEVGCIGKPIKKYKVYYEMQPVIYSEEK